jgi:hypothetical protein
MKTGVVRAGWRHLDAGGTFQEQRALRRIMVYMAAAALAAAPAAASEKKDVMAVVRQWTGVFTNGDPKLALAACADETSIIDDLPPHVWQGPGACSKWLNDFDSYLKKYEITDPSGTLAKPWHVDITADRAYVVVPINFAYKLKGKDVKETGDILTAALQKMSVGWRITAWSIAAR